MWVYSLLIAGTVFAVLAYVYLFAMSHVTNETSTVVYGSPPTPQELQGPQGAPGQNGTLKIMPVADQNRLRAQARKRAEFRDQILQWVEKYLFPILLLLLWFGGFWSYTAWISVIVLVIGFVFLLGYNMYYTPPQTTEGKKTSEQSVTSRANVKRYTYGVLTIFVLFVLYRFVRVVYRSPPEQIERRLESTQATLQELSRPRPKPAREEEEDSVLPTQTEMFFLIPLILFVAYALYSYSPPPNPDDESDNAEAGNV